MNIESSIMNIIQKPKYRGMNIRQLADQLQMTDSEAFSQLCRTLNHLTEENVLFLDAQNRYFTPEQLGYFIGILHLNQKGFGFVEADESSVYVAADALGLAIHQDKVVVQTQKKADGSQEGKIIQILEHAIHQVIGTIKIKAGKTFFLPDHYFYHRRFQLTNTDQFHLVNDTKVLVHIDRYDAILSAHIVKEVGYKYDPGVDILSVLYEHDIDPEFPAAVMKEVTKINDHVIKEDKVGRRSLLDLQIITIDGEDSRDLDDAVSVQVLDNGYRLGVHIADVSHYVQPGSELNAEAYERGTSVYVSDRVVPMLPHALSNGICSLNPKVERLTLTCMMDIDHQGEIIKYELFPSYIKTTERMTYTQVNAILEQDVAMCKKYAHIITLCENMKALAKILRRRRESLGAIDFDTKEAKIIINDQGKVKDIQVRERKEAERIIEDFMIAANECVAAHMKWMELPALYRIHETPDPKKMREFARIAMMLGYPLKADVNHVYPQQLQQLLIRAKEDEIYPVLSTFLLRSMQKARYDDHCLGHFGLGLSEYLHFTSPIRRYPDLLVHRMLHKYYFQSNQDPIKLQQDEQWMEQAAQQCSSRERIAIEAERDVDDMKKAEYMERFIGRDFTGVISGVTKFGFFVELDNTVEGLVHISTLHDDYYHYDEHSYCLIGERTGRKYRMGQTVAVRCVDASRFKKQVDFEIIRNAHKPFQIKKQAKHPTQRKSLRYHKQRKSKH